MNVWAWPIYWMYLFVKKNFRDNRSRVRSESWGLAWSKMCGFFCLFWCGWNYTGPVAVSYLFFSVPGRLYR